MNSSKDILKKLHGTWNTVFSDEHNTVDIELTINKKSRGNVKFLSGTKTKVVFFDIHFGNTIERDDVDSCFEVTLHYKRVEQYKGGVKTQEKDEKGKLYSLVAFSGDEIYFPFPNRSSEGDTKESRITELNQAFSRSKQTEEKKSAKNALLDLIFAGSHSILAMAGIHFNEKLQFVEACDETHIYNLSSYDTTVYNDLDKFRKIGCSLERVERFKWIYSLFTEWRDYEFDNLRTHWQSSEAIDKAYQEEKKQFEHDPNIMLYWVLHFGLLQDERIHELKHSVNSFLKQHDDSPIAERLKNSVELVESISQEKLLPSIQAIWYDRYYKNIFATSYNRSYSACLHSLLHHEDTPNTKAYWVVKNAKNSTDWLNINKQLNMNNASDERLGVSFIQANNPKLSSKIQSQYAEQYLNEMFENFRQYQGALNSWTSIVLIYEKVKNLSLLEKVIKLYFKAVLAIDDSDLIIEEHAEIVNYLHDNGLTSLKALKPIEEAIYEKLDAYGYTQILLRRYKSFISHKNKNLNEGKLEAYKTTGKALKATFKKIETSFIKKGFTKVTISGELLKNLKDQQPPKQSIKRMNHAEFHQAYPDIFLEDNIWFDDFFVYEENMHLNTHLDLDEKGDFSGGHVFLKNLTVNGNILNENSDYGHPLKVQGKTSAHSIISGGAFIEFNGDVTLKDLLAVYYNHGGTSFEGTLTARVVLDDEDHQFNKPSKLMTQYLFVNYYHDNNNNNDNEASYKTLDYTDLATVLKGEPWLTDDIAYEENDNGEEIEKDVQITSSWNIVDHIVDYGKFTDKIINDLAT